MGHDTIDAEIAACDALSRQATQAGAQAFARLLMLAEERDSGQIPRIARFLAATYNGQAFQFDLFDLRAVDIAISNECDKALRVAGDSQRLLQVFINLLNNARDASELDE